MAEHKERVIEVLGLLAEWDAGAPKRWENVTIPDYLEAIAAWLGGFEQARPGGRRGPAIPPRTSGRR